MELAGPLCGKQVLDFGCGDGKFTSELIASNPARVTGADISSVAIRYAAQRVPGAHFISITPPTLPFADASFDTLFCLDVLEHIPDEQLARTVREITRVLAPGGTLILSLPSTMKNLDRKHFRHYTPESIATLLDSSFHAYQYRGYFKAPSCIPIALFDRLYNRRYIWPLFSHLICATSQPDDALYFAVACRKAASQEYQ